MDPRETTKFVVRAGAELGAAYIVREIIKGNVPIPSRLDKRIAMVLGAIAIGGFVAAKAGNYIDRQIDELFEAYEKIKKELTK